VALRLPGDNIVRSVLPGGGFALPDLQNP